MITVWDMRVSATGPIRPMSINISKVWSAYGRDVKVILQIQLANMLLPDGKNEEEDVDESSYSLPGDVQIAVPSLQELRNLEL